MHACSTVTEELSLFGEGLHISSHELARRTALFTATFGVEVEVVDHAANGPHA
jgi:hypothetical protein